MAHVIDGMYPYRSIASAVIFQAVKELKRKDTRAGKKADIVRFFRSDWFDILAELSLLDSDAARDALGIPPIPLRGLSPAGGKKN